MLNYDFYSGHRLRTLRMVKSATVIYSFKVKRFRAVHLLLKNAQAAHVPGSFASTRTAPAPAVELLLLFVILYIQFQ